MCVCVDCFCFCFVLLLCCGGVLLSFTCGIFILEAIYSMTVVDLK